MVSRIQPRKQNMNSDRSILFGNKKRKRETYGENNVLTVEWILVILSFLQDV